MTTTTTTTPAPDLAVFLREYHSALDEFFRGNPEPAKRPYSQRADASLANPFGPVALGWPQVEQTMDRAASNYSDGGATGFETLMTYVTPDLAYLVEIERFAATVGGGDAESSGAHAGDQRAAPGGRRLEGLVHRHADPITAPRPAQSVIDP